MRTIENRIFSYFPDAVVDFSTYLNFICSDRRYCETRSLYTATDALLTLEAQKVERQKPENEVSATHKQIERLPVLAGLRKYSLGEQRQHVLLAGRPGSGKSTTLKQLLLEMAEAALTDETQPIPVLVQLKGDRSIIDLIIAEFRRAKQKVTAEQIDDWLLEDKLLLLLDGINEIPTEDLRRQLQQFRDDNSTISMIFTTRDLAVGGDLGIKQRLEMHPLTEPQMREFVQRYLPEHGELLLQQLKDRLREVAETPLLLKMLCDVFDPNTQQIPQSKGELFRLFDVKYDAFKGIATASTNFWRFKPELLQHLAFVMMQGNPEKPTEAWLTIGRDRAEQALERLLTGRVEAPGQRAKEWLEDLVEHHWLQVAADTRQVEFHHQLFQEYYAAEALLVMLHNKHSDMMDDRRLQHFYLNYLKWTEPLAMMLSLLEDETEAVRLVQLALDVDWLLGARLAGQVKPQLQEKTVAMVSNLKIQKPWKLGFIKFTRQVKVPQWLKVEIWRRTRSNVVIPDLLKLIEDSDSEVRWRAADALGKIGNQEAILGLLKLIEDSDSFGHWRAVDALGKIGSQEAISGLLKLIEDSDSTVRAWAADALGKIGNRKAIPGLLKLIEDSDSFGRWRAVDALGKIGSQEAIPGLLKLIEDSDSTVRAWVAAALGKIGSQEAIPGLLKLIEDSDSKVRWEAVDALGKIGSQEAVPGLLKLLPDFDSDVVNNEAVTLGIFDSQEVIPGLFTLSPDFDFKFDARWNAAAVALGKLGSQEAIPGLLKLLESFNSNVQLNAAHTLGNLGNLEAIPGLLRLLEYFDPHMRRGAAEALGRLGNLEAIPNLLKLLEDSDCYVRRGAAEALGELGSQEAIPNLLKLLEDSDCYVRRGAVDALGEIGSRAVIPDLLKLLQDSDCDVRLSAAEALGNFGGDILHEERCHRATHIFHNLVPCLHGANAFDALTFIQANCQFYNYSVKQWNLAPAESRHPISGTANVYIKAVEKLTLMSEQPPIFNQQGSTIGVNYAAEGSNPKVIQNVQNTQQSSPEASLSAVLQILQLLEQKYTFVQDEQQALSIIDAEFKEIKAKQLPQWKDLLNVKRLWNGGKKATVKVGEHFAESNPWGKGFVAFLEGMSEDVK